MRRASKRVGAGSARRSAYEERRLLDSPSSQDSELAAYIHPRLPPESSTLLLIASDLLLGWSFERVLPKNMEENTVTASPRARFRT